MESLVFPSLHARAILEVHVFRVNLQSHNTLYTLKYITSLSYTISRLREQEARINMKIISDFNEESNYKLSNSSSSYIIDVNANTWEKEMLQSQVLTVVDFWEEGCVWCRRFTPIYEETAAEYKDIITFVKLNIRESTDNHKMALTYGLIGKPTLLTFQKGRVINKVIGIKTKGRLKRALDDLLTSTGNTHARF